jgi:hypothetical protein
MRIIKKSITLRAASPYERDVWRCEVEDDAGNIHVHTGLDWEIEEIEGHIRERDRLTPEDVAKKISETLPAKIRKNWIKPDETQVKVRVNSDGKIIVSWVSAGRHTETLPLTKWEGYDYFIFDVRGSEMGHIFRFVCPEEKFCSTGECRNPGLF